MTPGELFAKHFSFFGKDASAEADAVYHDDVVVDFPYAPQHHTQRLEGKAAVVRFCSRVGDFFEGIGGSVDRVFETGDPNVAIVETTGWSTSKETGLPYRQNYIAVVTARDGKISHINEYYNPIKVLVAGGEIEEPGD